MLCVEGVPQMTPCFDDFFFLEIQNSVKLLYSELWYIAGKGYRLKSAKEKGIIQGRVHEKTGTSCQLSFPSGDIWKVLNSLSTNVSQHEVFPI